MCCGKSSLLHHAAAAAVVVESFGCWRDDDDDGDDGECYVRGGRLTTRRSRYETEEEKGRTAATAVRRSNGRCCHDLCGRTVVVADVQWQRTNEAQKVGVEAHDDRRQHVQSGKGRPEQTARAIQRESERVFRIGLRDRHPRRRLRLR